MDETIKKVGSNRKITIFATETTFNSGLYQEGLSNSDNQFIFKDSWQERINTIIQMIKETRELYEIGFYWDELIKDAIETDVVDIIIACTDLSVLKNNFSDKVNFIDSSQVLAESVEKEYLKY
ncbi:aspartate/glutamate racemase family protein [Alkaliphilus serpentinus]|uniref:aspartate/glutamate racemase family protein n=1 Tax=Alkaliphilus serpentinus TaxID=1482731 RepID=UPI001FAAA1B4|nr:aspartate/glutamate racemase family protein [Alkaliphilus serpentinus]